MAAAPLDTASAQSPSPSNAKLNSVANSVAPAAASSELTDFTHYKDLQRNLRNTVKKLNASAKVDAVIAENPTKSLDELVGEKKINNDQKAQALKKPALQATVTQIEEQIAHYQDFAAFYEQRLISQKAELEKAQEELKSLREQVPSKPVQVEKDDFSQQLLSLSKFLCAAATMRRAGNETLPENRAFEGVLYQVYGGSPDAVASMVKLIDGVDEKIVSVEGDTLEITYSKVKQLSEAETSVEEPAAEAASDPTTANAAYTELEDPTYVTEVNAPNEAVQADNLAPPPQTLVPEGANAVADATWEPHTDLASSTNTDGFIEVPRDPAETDTGLQATPGNITDDVQPETVPESIKPGSDEFKPIAHHQKQPSRGRGRGRGGRGGEGYRGRGRGDNRGRGRGRGGRGRGGPNGAPAAATPAPQ